MLMLMQGGCAPSSLFAKPRLSNLDQHIFSHVLCLMPTSPALSVSEMTATCQLSRCHLLELLPSTPETIVSFPLQYWSPVDRGHLRFLGPTHHQPRANTLAGLLLRPHDARCTTFNVKPSIYRRDASVCCELRSTHAFDVGSAVLLSLQASAE
jgi:hypothetical protein